MSQHYPTNDPNNQPTQQNPTQQNPAEQNPAQQNPSQAPVPYQQPGGYPAGSPDPYASPNPAGSPNPYGQPAPVPGRVTGIVGFVLSLLGPLTFVGLIVSIVAMVQSKKAGVKNGFALAGIIIGIVFTLALIAFIVVVAIGASALLQMCNELGPGTHVVDGIKYTCGYAG